MDRLGSISAFLRVAEYGSFAAAGKDLRISGSAVSKSVRRLEERLGVRLFNRTTRALSLTEEGALFRERCARLLCGLDEAEREMRERSASPSGLLKVDLPAALGRLKIVPALDRLTERFPDLRIEASLNDRIVDMIDAGLDAVVRIGEPKDSRLMMKRVGTVRYIVCAAPAYLARQGAPETPDDLAVHNCIRRLSRSGAPHAPWKFARPGTAERFEIDVSGTLSLDSNDAIIDAAVAGAGPAQLHTYMAEPYLTTGQLVQILPNHAADGPPISVLYPSSRFITPKVRIFIDFVAALLSGDAATVGNRSFAPATFR